MRLRSGRLIRLNNEFMVMNTRFHGLHQLLERLRGRRAPRRCWMRWSPAWRNLPGCSRRFATGRRHRRRRRAPRRTPRGRQAANA
ncbi:hypothetical protein ACFZOQ_05930 [Pseudomonas aeruginosa]